MLNNVVSIIVPVYNSSSYLTKCIESIISQTFENWQVIVINDGSSDNSAEILSTYSANDGRIRVYHLEENHGVAYARNFGVQQASGEYIYFLDSDDRLYPHTLEQFVSQIGGRPFLFGRNRKKLANMADTAVSFSFVKPQFAKQRLSVLNVLFRKSYLNQMKLMFDTTYTFFSDLSFLLPIFEQTDQIPQLTGLLYKKTRRMDPLATNALWSSSKELMLKEFIQMMFDQLKVYRQHRKVSAVLYNYFVLHYRARIQYDLNDPTIRASVMPELSLLVRQINATTLRARLKSLNYLETQAIRNKNNALLRTVLTLHKFVRMYRRVKKNRNNLNKFIYRRYFNGQSIQPNLVVLESFLGKSFADNTKAIYNHLLHTNDTRKLRFVWIIDRKDIFIPGNPIRVKRNSLRYFYYLARAKFWVSNARMPGFLMKRPDQIYLQTWHGTPLKRLGYDIENVVMPGTTTEKYRANFYKEAQKWDYLVSPNAYSSEIFRRAFKFSGTMLETGYPRNDILLTDNSADNVARLKKKVGIPSDKKVILYAPTWRDDDYHARGSYKFKLELDLLALRAQFGQEYVLLLRMHYLIADHLDTTGAEDFVYNVSNYDDISELYLLSDVLITDYSSVFFDFANLRRPILFFTYDINKYEEELRGFYIDMHTELPGPLCSTSDEIIAAIANLDDIVQHYQDRYNAFHARFCSLERGTASEDIVRAVFD